MRPKTIKRVECQNWTNYPIVNVIIETRSRKLEFTIFLKHPRSIYQRVGQNWDSLNHLANSPFFIIPKHTIV